jgi:hypothetical protein
VTQKRQSGGKSSSESAFFPAMADLVDHFIHGVHRTVQSWNLTPAIALPKAFRKSV